MGEAVVTVFEEVLITETVVPPAFVTYAYSPLGVKARPVGLLPTVTVDVTVFEAVLITETVPLP